MSQSQARAKYRGALRRFNSPSLSRKQRESLTIQPQSTTAKYNGFNKSTGKHEAVNPDGVVTPVNAPQNKPMGKGDQGYVNQGFFVL